MGVNVNAVQRDGWSALTFNATNGNLEIANLLLDAGANIDVADKDGWTPLMVAASHGYSDYCGLLQARGANPNLKNKDGQTALDIAKAVKEGKQKPKQAPHIAEADAAAAAENVH